MPSRQQQAVQEQFTKTAAAFSTYAARDTAEVLAERIAFAEPAPGDAVLDVACGPGKFVLAMAPRVRFDRGLDLTAEMLRQARDFQKGLGITNAGFDRGEAERLPYCAGTFDLVACQFAFHHIARPVGALEEMVRVTKPDGRLLLVDSLSPEDDARFELHNRIERLRDASHTVSLRLSTMLALFRTHGLEVVRQKVCRQPRSFDPWMLRAGLVPSDSRYRDVRQAIEDSLPGDRADYSPEIRGDDLSIVHREGMFLVRRH